MLAHAYSDAAQKRLRLRFFLSGFSNKTGSVLKNIWKNGFTCWIEIVKCPNCPSPYFSFFLFSFFLFFISFLFTPFLPLSTLSLHLPFQFPSCMLVAGRLHAQIRPASLPFRFPSNSSRLSTRRRPPACREVPPRQLPCAPVRALRASQLAQLARAPQIRPALAKPASAPALSSYRGPHGRRMRPPATRAAGERRVRALLCLRPLGQRRQAIWRSRWSRVEPRFGGSSSTKSLQRAEFPAASPEELVADTRLGGLQQKPVLEPELKPSQTGPECCNAENTIFVRIIS